MKLSKFYFAKLNSFSLQDGSTQWKKLWKTTKRMPTPFNNEVFFFEISRVITITFHEKSENKKYLLTFF